MEKAGYVRRLPFPDDSRVTLVALTDKGEAFRRDFDEVSELLLRTVWGDMGRSQKEEQVAGLEQILSNLE